MNTSKEQTQQDVFEIDLLEFLQAIFHNIFLIIIVAVICAGMLFAYAKYMATPMYETSAKIYVNNNSLSLGIAGASISSGDISAAKSLVNTYLVILNTRTTLEQVIERAGLKYSYDALSKMITAGAVENTEIFQVTVRGEDPEETKLIANTICDVLPDSISDVVDGSSVRIVDYAVAPTSSYAPSYTKYTFGGLALGAALAIGYIFISFITDDFIHGAEDITGAFDIPLLAGIPDLSDHSSGKYGYRSGGSGKRSGKGDRK